MSNFWRADDSATSMTIEEKVKLEITAGVLANPLINADTPPGLILTWAQGVTDAFLNVHFGRKEAPTGNEAVEDYTEIVNKRLAKLREQQENEE